MYHHPRSLYILKLKHRRVSLYICSFVTLCDPIDLARPLCPWDSPGKNTGEDCHFLL